MENNTPIKERCQIRHLARQLRASRRAFSRRSPIPGMLSTRSRRATLALLIRMPIITEAVIDEAVTARAGRKFRCGGEDSNMRSAALFRSITV